MKKLFAIAAVALIGCQLSACGVINDWNRGQHVKNKLADGQAELAQADGNRQIRIQEAKAAAEAATYTAQAEVTKAEGVAKANAIMSASLGGPEGYLRWKYIEMLQENKNATTIYVPTEAGLPILEASRKPG